MNKFTAYVQALPSHQGLILHSPVTRRYVTDFPSSDGVVFCARGKMQLFLDRRYLEMAQRRQAAGTLAPTWELADYPQYRQALTQAAADGVKQVWFEDRRTTCSQLKAWQQAFPTVEFLPLEDRLENLRMEKTPEELRRIEAAQALTGAAFEHLLTQLSPKMTERQAALILDFYMRQQGAEDVAFETICLSGTKTSLPHGRPEDLPLVPNSFITMDFGAKLDGYCADMTRTVCLGRADEEQKRVYQTVLEAQKAAIAAVKANVTGDQVDRAARQVIENAGYADAFTHSTGHGIGLEVHESPAFSPNWKKPIPAGAVLSVEPGIYLEGRFGVRIENMVLVTPQGCRDLTPVPRDLLEL